eukprot:6208012-Pleurochrysis_carterae.AAC.2
MQLAVNRWAFLAWLSGAFVVAFHEPGFPAFMSQHAVFSVIPESCVARACALLRSALGVLMHELRQWSDELTRGTSAYPAAAGGGSGGGDGNGGGGGVDVAIGRYGDVGTLSIGLGDGDEEDSGRGGGNGGGNGISGGRSGSVGGGGGRGSGGGDNAFAAVTWRGEVSGMFLPLHWHEAVDSAGRVYYFHEETRQAQWTPPPPPPPQPVLPPARPREPHLQRPQTSQKPSVQPSTTKSPREPSSATPQQSMQQQRSDQEPRTPSLALSAQPRSSSSWLSAVRAATARESPRRESFTRNNPKERHHSAHTNHSCVIDVPELTSSAKYTHRGS